MNLGPKFWVPGGPWQSIRVCSFPWFDLQSNRVPCFQTSLPCPLASIADKLSPCESICMSESICIHWCPSESTTVNRAQSVSLARTHYEPLHSNLFREPSVHPMPYSKLYLFDAASYGYSGCTPHAQPKNALTLHAAALHVAVTLAQPLKECNNADPPKQSPPESMCRAMKSQGSVTCFHPGQWLPYPMAAVHCHTRARGVPGVHSTHACPSPTV